MSKITVERLKELGLEGAGNELQGLEEFKRKTAIAYEHFRFVTPEKINEFNARLKEKTYNKEKYSYDKLGFTALKSYTEIPPENVLNDLEESKKKNCFDSYEVAKIESVVERPDPILFGRIDQCSDRFFVSQWDNDVAIEDILSENEG